MDAVNRVNPQHCLPFLRVGRKARVAFLERFDFVKGEFEACDDIPEDEFHVVPHGTTFDVVRLKISELHW